MCYPGRACRVFLLLFFLGGEGVGGTLIQFSCLIAHLPIHLLHSIESILWYEEEGPIVHEIIIFLVNRFLAHQSQRLRVSL